MIFSLVYWMGHLALWVGCLHKIYVSGVKCQHHALTIFSGLVVTWAILLVILDSSWGSDVIFWGYPFVCAYVITVYVRPTYITNWKDKAVFITGCDSGFGHALALRLDALGVKVFAGCLGRGEPGEQALEAAASKRLRTVRVDVTNQTLVDAAVQLVKDDLGPGQSLWCLVNNAGIVYNGEIEFSPMEDFQRCSAINCFGQIRMTKAMLPLIRAARGRVVNVASVIGRVAMYNMGAYCVSKFGVEAYSDVLRQEMRKWGVSVSVIEPGPYVTALGDEGYTAHVDKMWNEASDDVKKAYGRDYFDAYLRSAGFATEKNITPVLDAMEDAILSRSPHRIYAIGSGSILLPLLKVVCPSFIDTSEYLLKKYTRYLGVVPAALKEKQ